MRAGVEACFVILGTASPSSAASFGGCCESPSFTSSDWPLPLLSVSSGARLEPALGIGKGVVLVGLVAVGVAGWPGLAALVEIPDTDCRDVREAADGGAGGPMDVLVPTDGRGLADTAGCLGVLLTEERVEDVRESGFVGDFVGDYPKSY